MATRRCIVAGCLKPVSDKWTQTCEKCFKVHRATLEEFNVGQYRYPCAECGEVRWFNGDRDSCSCCSRPAREPKQADDDMAKDLFCSGCGVLMLHYNTPSNARWKSSGVARCGKCYLAWKAAERKRKGEK